MSEQELVQTIYELTEQLKGGPLNEFEKGKLKEVFSSATGSALDRAYAAMAEVLNTEPSLVERRIRSLERVEQAELAARLERAAEF
jgi:hypothetical protein